MTERASFLTHERGSGRILDMGFGREPTRVPNDCHHPLRDAPLDVPLIEVICERDDLRFEFQRQLDWDVICWQVQQRHGRTLAASLVIAEAHNGGEGALLLALPLTMEDESVQRVVDNLDNIQQVIVEVTGWPIKVRLSVSPIAGRPCGPPAA